MGISSLRKLLWVSTSSLQKCSSKLLLKQLSQASLLPFVNSRHNTVFSNSLIHSHWFLWHHKLPISPLKLQFGTLYTVGFLPALLFRPPFSSLFFLLPSHPVDIFQGALLTPSLFHIVYFYPSLDLIHSYGLSSSRDRQPSNIPLLHICTLLPFSWLTDTAILNITIELHIYPT